VIVRNAAEADLDRLAMIWHQGWHAAHASLVPVELTRLRTLLNFRERLKAALPDVRVAGPPVAPLGFYQLHDDELFQVGTCLCEQGAELVLPDDLQHRRRGRADRQE